MANIFKKALASLLALHLIIGTLGLSAFAEDTAVNEVIEITGDDSSTTVQTTTTTTETNPENGEISVTVTIQKDTDKVTEDGTTVERTDIVTETTVTDSDGNVLSAEGVSSGSEKTTEHVPPQDLTVDIPLTDTDDPDTEGDDTTDSAATGDGIKTEITGDIKESPEDTTYDQTTTTVIPGSVTVTTKEIEVTETVNKDDMNLEYVSSDAAPDADNDLFYHKSSIADIPGEGDELPEGKEGYPYVYIGSGNSSQFFAGLMYTSTDNPDEEPVYTDEFGTNYYLRSKKPSHHGYDVEGIYVNGKKETTEALPASWDSIQQFVMLDTATGKTASTYCADEDTMAYRGASYKLQNLEDANYYTEEQAAKIRAIAANGYWGADATADSDFGSLEAMRNMMREAKDADGNNVFTQEEIDSLTDGIAMTATQYAIWTYSNAMSDVAYVNVRYVPVSASKNFVKDLTYYGQFSKIPTDEQDSVDLIFKLYNHLINLDPSSVEEKTTANTLINPKNFLEDVSLTVVDKADGHANNADDDTENDAYVTNLSFRLIVEPSDERGDSLLVKVLDLNNNVIAQGRIAGELKPGETRLKCDDNGNYVFEGITMTEGEQNFNITIEGIQNLEHGVYLYTSDVVNEAPSQTMVGVLEGTHSVDVSMNISFELSVEDELVITEEIWSDEWETSVTAETEPEETEPEESEPEESEPEESEPEESEPEESEPEESEPEESEPEESEPVETETEPEEIEELTEIPDDEIPLASVPQTGDLSAAWFAVTALLAIALFGTVICEKKSRA